MFKTRAIIFTILILLAVGHESAVACPMCKPGGGAGTVAAYQGTTIFLALLPFAFLAAMFYWLKKKINKTNETHPY